MRRALSLRVGVALKLRLFSSCIATNGVADTSALLTRRIRGTLGIGEALWGTLALSVEEALEKQIEEDRKGPTVLQEQTPLLQTPLGEH